MSQDPEPYLAPGNGRPARQYTTTSFAIRQLLPAAGWQSVYHEEGTHFTTPVVALALVRRILRDCGTLEVVLEENIPGWSAEEDWDIVSLEYSSAQGWAISDDSSNFCGLLPPGVPLDTFEAPCTHPPARPEV